MNWSGGVAQYVQSLYNREQISQHIAAGEYILNPLKPTVVSSVVDVVVSSLFGTVVDVVVVVGFGILGFGIASTLTVPS